MEVSDDLKVTEEYDLEELDGENLDLAEELDLTEDPDDMSEDTEDMAEDTAAELETQEDGEEDLPETVEDDAEDTEE